MSNFMLNQDLFRASVQALDPVLVQRAFNWLRGEGPYPLPTSIHLDLTFRCNARCRHCRQWTWPRRPEFNPAQLKKLFGIFQKWGVETVTFGGGNPLLFEHLDLAFQLSKQANIKIGVISEGGFISDKLANTICENAEWMRFSIDGPKAVIHDQIRNSDGLFDCVLDNIRKLKAHNSGLKVGINCLVQKSNIRYLSGMFELSDTIGADVLLLKVPHGDIARDHVMPSKDDWKFFRDWLDVFEHSKYNVRTNIIALRNLLKRIYDIDDIIEGKPVQSFYRNQNIKCFVPLFFLSCDSQGNMSPCDYLQADTRTWSGKYGELRERFRLGNVLENETRVLENLDMMMRSTIHNLPAQGYSECGCCTRFCQFNAVMNSMYYSGQTQQIPVTVQQEPQSHSVELFFL